MDNSGALTKIASISVGDTDTVWLVRHYTGLGAFQKYMVCHVFRDNKFLGRFESDQWVAGEHHKPATDSDLSKFRKARDTLVKAADLLWT